MMPPPIQIIADVAASRGITMAALRAPGRKGGAPMFEARSEAARRLRTERGLSLNQIGRYLGGRHHTVVLRMIDEAFRQRTIAKNIGRLKELRRQLKASR